MIKLAEIFLKLLKEIEVSPEASQLMSRFTNKYRDGNVINLNTDPLYLEVTKYKVKNPGTNDVVGIYYQPDDAIKAAKEYRRQNKIKLKIEKYKGVLYPKDQF